MLLGYSWGFSGVNLLPLDNLEPHVWHQRRGDFDGAISLLEILQHGDDAAADRYDGADNHNPSGPCYLDLDNVP